MVAITKNSHNLDRLRVTIYNIMALNYIVLSVKAVVVATGKLVKGRWSRVGEDLCLTGMLDRRQDRALVLDLGKRDGAN